LPARRQIILGTAIPHKPPYKSRRGPAPQGSSPFSPLSRFRDAVSPGTRPIPTPRTPAVSFAKQARAGRFMKSIIQQAEHGGTGTDLVPRFVPRNPGTGLELDWVRDVRVNRSAVERRAATLGTRRSVKKEWQAAWLLRASTLVDLTTLSGDDTPGRVRRLCAKARQPVRPDLLEQLGASDLRIRVAAVCVYHSMVPTAVEALAGSGIPVAAVSTGFPAGLSPFDQRVEEIQASVAAGADEIDIVITRAHVLTGNWPALFGEVRAFRSACGDAHMKTILGTGDLGTLRNVARASLVCMMAGADFIKTSTGKESVNAVLPV